MVAVKSSAAEGDFMTYTATVVQVLKNTDKGPVRHNSLGSETSVHMSRPAVLHTTVLKRLTPPRVHHLFVL